MSAKYRRLTQHLANRDKRPWVAKFSDVEQILGFSLPDSARAYQAWWSNQMRSQSLAWQSAGWRTSDLDIHGERVTFSFVGDQADEPVTTACASPPLTIAAAKAGLAAAFGVDSSQVEITIKA